MTLWLSVDPMADKYPSISPYAYCAWNPVKLVDPDGCIIDDYFSFSGKYLGSDNKETKNVRIIDESMWNSSKDNNGNVDYALANIMSCSFSNASTHGMSEESQLSVYQYYNPMKKYHVENYPPNEPPKEHSGMEARIGLSGKDDAVLNHLYIYLENNRLQNKSGMALCDNAFEITSCFVHERNHVRRAKKMGYQQWSQMNKTANGRLDIESSAIETQRMNSSWNGCSDHFKSGINNYEKYLKDEAEK